MKFYFSSWQDFFHMGGYAVSVWSAYALVLLAWTLFIWRVYRRLHRQLKVRKYA